MKCAVTYRCLERTGSGWIEEGGWVQESHGIPQERSISAWQVSYVHRGCGWFRDGLGNRARISAGSWYSLYPGLVHAYAPDSGTTWDESFCIFNGPIGYFLERHAVLDRQRPVRRAEPCDYWRRRFEGLTTDRNNLVPASIMLQLAAVITELATAESAIGGWLAAAQRDLDPTVPGVETPLAHIARQHGLSEAAFRKRFTRLSGIAPGHWRERRRLERACDLMLSQDATLQVVAEATGFADAFHLSRRFKAVLGMSPRQWRQRLPQ